eukprot:TRINITY_DN2726_c0_g2_i1.p1 TRINITY_DN2726_c0_g2~~TRINITY_DN2726_c0_g2_i1.p1  ORF type:complete len:188 (+),score=28.49 TRINITY_DN2726_c0_g2_i1:117-680(+)
MAYAGVKSVAGVLLLLNFCMYVVVAAISGWALNKTLDHSYTIAGGRGLPFGFSPIYFPMGNPATGFLIIFALIAGVVGAGSCLSGLHHLRVWTEQSLASSASSAMTSWALTLLAMGLACKEAHVGDRNTKLKTVESLLIVLSGTQLFYMLLIHAGYFGGKYCSYQETYVATTTAEPQKGNPSATGSV